MIKCGLFLFLGRVSVIHWGGTSSQMWFRSCKSANQPATLPAPTQSHPPQNITDMNHLLSTFLLYMITNYVAGLLCDNRRGNDGARSRRPSRHAPQSKWVKITRPEVGIKNWDPARERAESSTMCRNAFVYFCKMPMRSCPLPFNINRAVQMWALKEAAIRNSWECFAREGDDGYNI